jgi:Protein of unknown function (DUF4239)
VLLVKVLLVIFSISLIISLLLILVRRLTGFPERLRGRIQSPLFGFFATIYAFFLGFAIVTLWSNFVTTKFNVTWEAYSLLSSYRLAQTLPNSEGFRKGLLEYVKTVLDSEWGDMAAGLMNDQANRQIETVWNRLQEMKPADKQDNPIFVNIVTNLNEARRQRLARGIALSGNLYQPIWVIIVFGLVTTVYSLYFMHPEQNVIQIIFVFMILFTILACIYFIVDLDTPFSGLVRIAPGAFQEVYNEMTALR